MPEKFKTIEEWKAAGMPPGLEPAPQPVVEPPPIPLPPTIDLEQREQEFIEAIALSERVAAGEVLPREQFPDQYGVDYWKSIEDIKAKQAMLQQAKKIEASSEETGVSLTPEERQFIEQSKAIATSEVSPFIQVTPEGKIEIITKLTTIEKVGVPLAEFERLGFTSETLRRIGESEETAKRAREIITELNKYADLPTAIREGNITLLREAQQLGMITPMQVVDMQIAASAVPSPPPQDIFSETLERTKAIRDLEPYKRIVPEEGVFMIAEGQEPPMREVYLISQYLSDNADNLEKVAEAKTVLVDAGFTDEQIQQALQDAFTSALGGIDAVTEDVKRPGWFEGKVTGLENWHDELQSDLDESLKDAMGRAYLARLGITLAGGLAKTALVTATALPILTEILSPLTTL